ncbi:hypothetical protein [Lactococcus lactis]|uniref:Uncharacterized protein n=1 Tax=Lactococcus lactis subsp. lactis TaxID=1360 RepID=A0AAC9R069_LACLL|nr:hypothetical protein [Lactococcus lactis]ARD95880.1 hypothetical protein LL229_0995 [Lactococcus lactis subsp. lactis]ARE09182.1 hypothetical protein LLUC77_2069 [Lactococcus lactis subsp. lactis]MRK42535.1 hypothetical protein [Lactococcus lactis subsp. lactis]
MNYIIASLMISLTTTHIITSLQLETSDLISLASVVISALSLVGALITYIIKSISDYNKKIEEMRPNVFISYENEFSYGLFNQRLILKNYGKTTAWISSISINPPFENKGGADFSANTFATIKDFPLAPSQKLDTIIGVSGALDEKIIKANREYIINYESEDRKQQYTSRYIVNEEGYPVLRRIDKSKNVIEIKNSIKTVSEELKKLTIKVLK